MVALTACAMVLLLLRPTSCLITSQVASDATPAWMKLSPTGEPPTVRDDSAGAWTGDQLMIFGGYFGGFSRNDLWSYKVAQNSWEELNATNKPAARSMATMVWSPFSSKLLMFGGKLEGTWPPPVAADLWAYSPSTNSWVEEVHPPGPVGRWGHAAAWLPGTNELAIFGGVDSTMTNHLDDLWAYKDHTTQWSQLPLAGSVAPSPRQFATMNFADNYGFLLVFGGYDGTSRLNDLYTYSFSTAWMPLTPSGGSQPPPRSMHSAAWDDAEKKLFVFGGLGITGELDDLWAYSVPTNSWELLSPSVPTDGERRVNVGERRGHVGLWAKDKMLMFGGYGNGHKYNNDLWTLSFDKSQARSQASAKGDPHLQNVNGERFELLRPGMHVLLHIPRGAEAPHILLRVVAETRRVGTACGEMYFQNLNITGAWVDAKRGGSLQFHASEIGGEEEPTWMTFGVVDLKVVRGRNQLGIRYLNLFAKHLGHSGFKIGGLLGEDDHTEEASPDHDCYQTWNLYGTMPGLSSTPPNAHSASSAEASLA